MYLSDVVIKNFRNLKDFNLTLFPGLNVLIGENNVGKTNLLDAIRLCLGYHSNSNELLRISEGDFFQDASGKRTTEAIEIDLTFSGLSDEDLSEFIEILNYNAQAPSNSTASIHYRCLWSDKNDRCVPKQWGGNRANSEAAVPTEVLQSIQVTYLTALRNATDSLTPGRNNRLARLLKTSAKETDEKEIEKIFEEANTALKQQEILKVVETQLNRALESTTGAIMKQSTVIRASEPKFDQIVKNLRLALRLATTTGESEGGGEASIQELHLNGLGYNNLLFLATVLAELEKSKDATLPLFLVEEPEAHLHPQLQSVLTDFLAHKKGFELKNEKVQTIVTTHSPSIASYVSINSINVIHRMNHDNVKSFPLKDAALSYEEEMKLKRMLDVTRATLLFARGVILVEGITESILLPILSKREGINLDDHHISVVPVCGVEFASIAKLFAENRINIPVSILTDGDPEIIQETSEGKTWHTEIPKKDADEKFLLCERVIKLKSEFSQNLSVRVFNSDVTLEYDLAVSGPENPKHMTTAWEKLFKQGRGSGLLKQADVTEGTINKKALKVWRVICRSESTKNKAEFAQSLSSILMEKDKDNKYVIPVTNFTVPNYIKEALKHVTKR